MFPLKSPLLLFLKKTFPLVETLTMTATEGPEQTETSHAMTKTMRADFEDAGDCRNDDDDDDDDDGLGLDLDLDL